MKRNQLMIRGMQKIILRPIVLISIGLVLVTVSDSYAETTEASKKTMSDNIDSPKTIEENGSQIKSGTIIVSSPSTKETTVHGLSSDGKIRAEITASNPITGEPMSINIKFRDASGALKKNANYDMSITQNGKEILSAPKSYDKDGNGIYNTEPLESDVQVDFKITLLGFGFPDDEINWSGPKGEVLMFNIVPEFGTITSMILAIAIVSIVIITAKTRNIIMSRS